MHGIKDGKIVLAFSSKFHRDKVAEAKALHEVEGVLKEHFTRFVPLECILLTSDDAPEIRADKSKVNMVEAVAEIFGA